ncbi:MAG: hypothetical protein IT236_06010 [Bacteroidia bacterium]|nr:hypothetical protein [Bacteroidia bacterium]
MARFRIDYLELTLIEGTELYNLKGKCNLDKPASNELLIGTLDGYELSFKSPNDLTDKKVEFEANNLDFSIFDYETEDTLDLSFADPGIAKVKKGGVVIKDTKYPPPGGFLPPKEHLGFTSQFKIKQFQCFRIGVSNIFLINVSLYYSSKFAEYSKESYEYFADTVPNRSAMVMRLNLDQHFDNLPHSTNPGNPILFDDTATQLNQADGVPIVVIEKNTIWNKDIDVKKANIFIE